jgi:hypothetical protein
VRVRIDVGLRRLERAFQRREQYVCGVSAFHRDAVLAGLAIQQRDRLGMVRRLDEASRHPAALQPALAETLRQRPGEMTEHRDSRHQRTRESEAPRDVVAVNLVLARFRKIACDGAVDGHAYSSHASR